MCYLLPKPMKPVRDKELIVILLTWIRFNLIWQLENVESLVIGFKLKLILKQDTGQERESKSTTIIITSLMQEFLSKINGGFNLILVDNIRTVFASSY